MLLHHRRLGSRRGDVTPAARWGCARAVAVGPRALALDGDTAVVLDAPDDIVRSRWSLTDGALVSRAPLWPNAGTVSVALSPSGAIALRFGPKGAVERADGARVAAATTLAHTPRAGAFSRDGARLALWRHSTLRSTNAAIDVDIMDMASGAVEASLRGCNHLAWSPDGRSLVTYDEGLRRWTARDGRGPVRWTESVQDVVFVNNDELVLLEWTGELTFVRDESAGFVAEAVVPHPAHPNVMRIVHADARVVVTTVLRRDERTEVWSLDRATAAWRRLGDVACRDELVMSDGARAVAFDRNALVCWDVTTGAEARWHRGFGAAVEAVAVRGRRVAAHDGAGDVRVFDAESLGEAWALEPGSLRANSRPRALTFSPDVRSLLTVTRREGLVRWDLATGAIAATGARVRSSPERLVLAPDGSAALALAGDAMFDREPRVRRIDLHGEARWSRFAANASTRRRDALDARYVAGGRVHVLWGDTGQRETFDAVTGASLDCGDELAWRSARGCLAEDGAFAALRPAGPDRARSVVWVGVASETHAWLGVASDDAQMVFAGERLVVCDGGDWGLWQGEGGSMARVARLEDDGCTATALAYDDATGTLAVGTAEGTLVVFALSRA
jgi:hypothetical protein